MDAPPDVPENVRTTVVKRKFYVPSSGVSDEAMVVYTRMTHWQCMHCEGTVGDGSTVIVNELGVVMLFCSQMCLGDFFHMHGMMEIYDELSDKAKMRNAIAEGKENAG